LVVLLFILLPHRILLFLSHLFIIKDIQLVVLM